MSKGSFDGKVIIVTGGTSGIGKFVALELAKEGCKVVVCGRRDKEGEEVIAEIKKTGGEGLFVKTDISKPDDCKNMVEKTVSKFGKLDGAFNNAGVSFFSKFHEQDIKHMQQTININVLGTMYCCKYEIEQMLKQKT
eukprot:UN23312